MYEWGVLARKPCGLCPHSMLRPFEIPVGRQWRWCDFWDQEVGQTEIKLTNGREWKRMCYICMAASNSWFPCSTLSCTASLIPRSKFKFEWSIKWKDSHYIQCTSAHLMHNWTSHRRVVRFQHLSPAHDTYPSVLSPQIQIRTKNDRVFMVTPMKGVQHIHHIFAYSMHQWTWNTCVVML